MMASRNSQVISSNGEIPGRVKWREKESPVARAGAARKGAAAPALLAVCIPERLFTGFGFEVCIGFIGGDSPSSILFCRSYRSILCCRLARDLQSCVVSRFRLPLQIAASETAGLGQCRSGLPVSFDSQCGVEGPARAFAVTAGSTTARPELRWRDFDPFALH